MGFVENVSFDRFPLQSNLVGEAVDVCFHYDASRIIEGKIVRDDIRAPWRMIIALADGRYVLSTECQWSRPASGFTVRQLTPPRVEETWTAREDIL